MQPLPTLQTAGEPGGLAQRGRRLINALLLISHCDYLTFQSDSKGVNGIIETQDGTGVSGIGQHLERTCMRTQTHTNHGEVSVLNFGGVGCTRHESIMT